MWFIAIEEGEWRCLSGAMRGGVVVEFSRGEGLYPFGQVIGAKDVEIGLEFLIGLFSLSISLRVVGVTVLFPHRSVLLFFHTHCLLTWRGRRLYTNTSYLFIRTNSSFCFFDLSTDLANS